MHEEYLDLTFLYDISDNDPKYIYDVIEIFLGTAPDGLIKLESLVSDAVDYEAIYKQAHFLKSSFSIVKVKNLYEMLAKIEMLAKNDGPEASNEISLLVKAVMDTFNTAHPLIIAEMSKHAPAQ